MVQVTGSTASVASRCSTVIGGIAAAAAVRATLAGWSRTVLANRVDSVSAAVAGWMPWS